MLVGLLSQLPAHIDPSAPYPLADALCAGGCDVTVIDPDHVRATLRADGTIEVDIAGEAVPDLDLLILRTRSARHLDAAASLASRAVRCVSPIESTRTASDKWLAHLCFAGAGVPSVATALCQSWEDVTALLEREWTSGFLLKPRWGSRGRGIRFVRDRADIDRAAREFTGSASDVICQAFVRLDPPLDYRAFVVGDEVVAWMERTAVEGSFVSNLSAGGRGAAVSPPPAWAHLAVSAARSIGVEIAGVDILDVAGDPAVIEVNPTPGFRGIESWTERDVCGAIAAYAARPSRQVV